MTVTDSLDPRAWDAFVKSHPNGTIFHTQAWRRAVTETFRHEPIYLAARKSGETVGVLPLFFIRSRLTGRTLISVPYGVGGGILANDGETVDALWPHALDLAGQLSCRRIELRSEVAAVESIETVDRYVGFCGELPPSTDQVLGALPRKARAAVRNAQNKFGLEVTYDERLLREVWHLYALNMRRLGSLAYPFAFFRRLADNLPGRYWVSLVRHDGRIVAGLLTFLFQDTVIPYFFGCTRDARACGAANLIYCGAMERGVSAGYRRFDFGRSRRDNLGSCNFKKFQGFTARPLGYQRWIAPGTPAPDWTPTNPRFRAIRKMWPYLPLCVSNRLSAWASLHIPG